MEQADDNMHMQTAFVGFVCKVWSCNVCYQYNKKYFGDLMRDFFN